MQSCVCKRRLFSLLVIPFSLTVIQSGHQQELLPSGAALSLGVLILHPFLVLAIRLLLLVRVLDATAGVAAGVVPDQLVAVRVILLRVGDGPLAQVLCRGADGSALGCGLRGLLE
jgi:hypothetical protein